MSNWDLIMVLVTVLISVSLSQNVSADETHPWDVNEDGAVNIADVALVVKHFSDTDAAEGDVNDDGLVNIADLILVCSHLGEIYELAVDMPAQTIGTGRAKMVFIPAGEFQMGDAFNEGPDWERPVHTVYVDAFYMDIYEVTNSQYKIFMDATRRSEPQFWHDSYLNAPDQPVVGVTWRDAVAYAQWAGKRLPTEAEWEKAARGGLVRKRYVWGDSDLPPEGAGNLADEKFREICPDCYIFAGYDDGYFSSAPVGSFAPNGYGLYDMAGNVWEWCADWYDEDYYANSPHSNPQGAGSGEYRVLRGGSWSMNPYVARIAARPAGGVPTSWRYDVGFRCVRQLGRDIISQGGAPMSLVPAGEFQMGTDPGEIPELVEWEKSSGRSRAEASWFEDETPLHTVYLDAFYMDIYEVTNAQYAKFVDATGYKAPRSWDNPRYTVPDHPVVGVNWHDAVAYAKWAGKRLPTEAEWEKAARGGLVRKHYPWGDEAPDEDGIYRANYRDTDTQSGRSDITPEGSFAPNGYWLHDMAGNVSEWCADWYDAGYYENSPLINPQGLEAGSYRVIRGGSKISRASGLRVAGRSYGNPNNTGYSIGFRCVRDFTP